MSSIIEGYNYDIFISYRQKDNKHDGWVTEFVDNLKGELESTFKEEISVYFDINPHDGLLDTHDVDASLKDKLKCLVFIPIISRTYCDPKSFAWEYEFKAFIDQASKDHFGLKIKLPNGNVANRMIPVQIHDLSSADKALVEKEIGAVLRAIEFIYREPGINKPLTADDDEKKNLNNTKFKLQINKVANAIDEVIRSLIGSQTTPGKKVQYEQPSTFLQGEGKSRELTGRPSISLKSKKWLVILLSLVLCIMVAFAIFKIILGSKKTNDIAKIEKSIAVLPFVNDSPDQENTYFINGIMDEILNNLQKIKDLRVLSRTSVEKYRGSTKLSIPEIAKDLDINYIVEGSGQKYGNTFRLRVQLISAKNERHLWGESYEQEIQNTKDIFRIQSQIAQSIVEALKASITPDEKQRIEKTSITNLTAYDFYMRGKEEYNKGNLDKASDLYNKAFENDSAFAPAYTGLADVYWDKHINEQFYSRSFLDSVLVLCDIALSYDSQLSDAYTIKGRYYTTINKPEQSIKEYNEAIKLNPNDGYAYMGRGDVYYYYENDMVQALDNFLKVTSVDRGELLPVILGNSINLAFLQAGFIEEAKNYIQKAFELSGDSLTYYAFLSNLETSSGNYESSIAYLEKGLLIDSTATHILYRLGSTHMLLRKYSEALKYFKKCLELNIDQSYSAIASGFYYNLGSAYWQVGDRKKAEYYLSKQIDYSNKQIEFGRTSYVTSQKYLILASVYSLMGKEEEAYKNLRIINQMHKIDFPSINNLKQNPSFDNLREEKEFQKIVSELEAKYQAEHERVRKWLEEQGKL
jgi:TolB-like protein/Tfp pilus assembly protein PilF